MRPSVGALRAEISRLGMDLAAAEIRLAVIERTCGHSEWEDIEPRIDAKAAYIIEAVELGVDSTPEMHVPAKRTVYHRRRCTSCGLIQETTKTKPVISSHVPNFG